MRRLVALTSATVLFNTIFLAALVPLLPGLAERFELSRLGSGVLVASYAAGVLAAALPAGVLVSRLGPRPTVLTGLALMSLSSVLFAFAPGIVVLDLARFGQGAASAIGWTGAVAWLVTSVPVERRGESMGMTMSATVVGALLGPVLGAAAGVAGTEAAFSAVAALGIVLALWAAATPGAAPSEPQPLRALVGGFRSEPLLRLGVWLAVLTASVFGAVSTLAPLRLSDLGWAAVGVGAAYFVTAALQTIASPLVGRWSDRRGRLVPVRAALLLGTLGLAAMAWAANAWVLAALVVAVGLVTSTFWVSAMAVAADGTEAASLDAGLGLTLLNVAWAPAYMVGAAAGGALAGLSGDALPFLALAAVCAATLALVRGRVAERPRAELAYEGSRAP